MVDIEKNDRYKKWWIWKNVGYRRNNRYGKNGRYIKMQNMEKLQILKKDGYIKIAYEKKMTDMEKWRIWKKWCIRKNEVKAYYDLLVSSILCVFQHFLFLHVYFLLRDLFWKLYSSLKLRVTQINLTFFYKEKYCIQRL